MVQHSRATNEYLFVKNKTPYSKKGDIVRVLMNNTSALRKGYTGMNFSQILYRVDGLENKQGFHMYTLSDLLSSRKLVGNFHEAELRKVILNEELLPKQKIFYDHVRDNNYETEIFTRLPGERTAKWVPVESLYPYYNDSEAKVSSQEAKSSY